MTATSLAAPQTRQRCPAWAELRPNKSAPVGAVSVAFLVILATPAPLLPIPDPAATHRGAIGKPPSAEAWPGTVEIGRDLVSRLIRGVDASFLAGVVLVMIAVAVGVPFGLFSGCFGGSPLEATDPREHRPLPKEQG